MILNTHKKYSRKKHQNVHENKFIIDTKFKDETRYNAWDRWSSSDSEIAIFIKGKWITKEYKDEGDDVIGYQTPDQVAEAIKWARNYKVINEGE